MLVAVTVFLVMFLVLVLGGLYLVHREGVSQRINEAISMPTQRRSGRPLDQLRMSIPELVSRFQSVLPRSEKDRTKSELNLRRAGYRSEQAINVYYGSKILVPVGLSVLAFVTGLVSLNPALVLVICIGCGYLAPDTLLDRLVANRKDRLRLALPDVLDLIIICIEAGLSADQATQRAERELSRSFPDLCDELHVLILEQRAGRSRTEAWRNLADRTDVESIRNLAGILIQAEQFGTSIAKSLRIHADTLRQQRIQSIEELAGKTSVKLVFPLVLFIFPALFIILLGPAVIQFLGTVSDMR